jgi:hypothetical protein
MQKHFTLLFLLMLVYWGASAQKLDSLIDIQRSADPQEKIYIQFDKNYYNPGETIWFKAYLFAGIEPSERSKNFYAELLDEQGNLLSQKTAPVSFSGAAGSFDIDSNFTKRIIYFRAYTIAMLNGDTSFLYTKAIRILSPKSFIAKTATPPSPPALSFLPEGGDWVAGLPSTMAFIATNQEGMPVAIIGSVMDNKGIKVADFRTLQNGMGRFTLTPEEAKTYTATWKEEAGKHYTTPLPACKPQGVSLKLTDEEGNKRFIINRTQGVQEPMKQLHIIGYMNQHLLFQANVDFLNKITASGIFPTQNLPSGILQVTVFDSSYKPLAERITFVNNYDYEFDADVFIAQKNMTNRGLNQVEVTLSDTMPANLSLAITDAGLNESNPLDDNIISHLLLTGDLRGKIVNPYHYFFSNSDSAAIYLDLVMLTHGWRRYNWDNVLARKTVAPRWKENNYLTLSGQIAGLLPGSISTDLQLTGILQTADSATNFINLPVDRKGKVFTEGLIFYDKAKLFFNFNKKNLSFDKSMLIVDNGLRKGFTKAIPDTTVKKGMLEPATATIASNIKATKIALQNRQLSYLKSGMLENVTIKAKVKTTSDKMEEKYVSGLFAGDAKSFDLVNDPLASGYMDIFQYLQGKVAGLAINTGGGTPSLSWRGGTPALYLNDMQTDASMLSGTPVSDIAYVKIFRPGESIASGGGGGVISIYTRKGGDAQPNPNTRGLSYVQMTGYSAIRQFYSPDYATVSNGDSFEDVRSTLYWNPFIFLDKNRKRLRLQFYNNDITKRYRLVMEGINAEGKLFHVEKEVGK